MPDRKEQHLLLLETVKLGHRRRGTDLQHAQQREAENESEKDPIEVTEAGAPGVNMAYVQCSDTRYWPEPAGGAADVTSLGASPGLSGFGVSAMWMLPAALRCLVT